MNIRELKLFRHLAGSLHFGRTSQACNITPSGLTRALQRLETELGHQLFFRNKRSVSLTPAGLIFKEYVEDAIQRWNELQNTLSGDQALRGELSLYCSVTAILTILPDIFSRFRKSYPEISLHLQTGDAAKAIFKLQNSEADISVAALPDNPPESIDFLKIIDTPLIFIAPKEQLGTVQYRGAEVDWIRTPVIVAERGLSRDRVFRWFANMGVVPNIYSQVAGNEAIIAMVGMGCGIGVVPELVLEQSVLKDQVKTIEVTPPLKPFTVGFCTTARNSSNPVVAAFLETAKSEDYWQASL